MRTLSLILLCCLATASGLRAQSDEASLLKRLDSQYRSSINPENAPKFDTANRKFEGASEAGLDKTASLKSAYDGSRSFDNMTKKETRSFFGIKNPWFGNKVFITEDAFLKKKKALGKDGNTFVTKEAASKEYADTDKTLTTRADPQPRPQVVPRGTSQGSVDAMEGKSNQKLTVEQVRELLNKN